MSHSPTILRFFATGGAVSYDGGVRDEELDKNGDNHKIESYSKVEYLLKYDNGWKVAIKNNQSSNQKDFLLNSSSHSK